MPLLKMFEIVQDSWRHLADADPLPDSGAVTVTAERLERDWDQLARFTGLLGARLPVSAAVHQLEPVLPQLSLIILPFHAFSDGRAYSIARQLRLDGYRGELRASGNILPDQIQLMQQVGFDSYDVSERFPLSVWQKASRQMALSYQRGLYRTAGEREVWSERHRGFSPWEEQPHAG